MATLNPLNAATSFNEYDLDEDGEPVTAVPQRVQAVAVPQRAQFASNNPLADLENAVPFSYSDGTSMVADKGGWQVRSKKTVSVGNAIILEIESWERLWMVTPGTDKAPKECVAYSRDGVNCNNPEQGTLQEHLAMLKASNYPNAKLEERVIVFGFYEGSERPFPSDMETPEYVQLDLSPTSAKAFHSYVRLLEGSIRRGSIPAEKAKFVKFSIGIAESKKTSSTYAAVSMACPYKATAATRQLLIGS